MNCNETEDYTKKIVFINEVLLGSYYDQCGMCSCLGLSLPAGCVKTFLFLNVIVVQFGLERLNFEVNLHCY